MKACNDTIYDTLIVKPTMGSFDVDNQTAIYPKVIYEREDSVIINKIAVSDYSPPANISNNYHIRWLSSFGASRLWSYFNTFELNTYTVFPDSVICPGDSLFVSANYNSLNPMIWEATREPMPMPFEQPTLITSPGTYRYYIDYRGLCPDYRDSIVIPRGPNCITSVNPREILEAKSVANIVTPNGDGTNDAFVLPNPQRAALRLYNKWSRPVYSTDSYKGEWPMAETLPGVYFYKLEQGGKTTSGWVEVVR
jgi:hypothetical protein